MAVGLLTVGATGASVSTVNRRVVVVPVLPAASVALTLTVCAPSAMPTLGVQLQLPLASAVVVHRVTPFSISFTMLPGSALPVRVGVLSLVSPFAAGVLTVGVPGAIESTVTVMGDVVRLPPGSVRVAATLVVP